nr:hypothetical protein [Actinomadura montaniterrae]
MRDDPVEVAGDLEGVGVEDDVEGRAGQPGILGGRGRVLDGLSAVRLLRHRGRFGGRVQRDDVQAESRQPSGEQASPAADDQCGPSGRLDPEPAEREAHVLQPHALEREGPDVASVDRAGRPRV